MKFTDKRQLLLEYSKCASEPIYTIENYFTTFDKTQESFVPFVLIGKQNLLIKNYERERFNLVLKYRQAGITTVTAAYCAVKVAFAPKENPEKILILANKQETAIEFLNKIMEFIKQLPEWVNISLPKEAQKHVKLSNGSQLKAVATSPDALRGYTPTILILDEAAFIEGGQALWSACLASISTGGKAFLISTPNGLDEIYYEAYDGSINKKNTFVITHLKWWEDTRFNKDLRMIKTNDLITWIEKPAAEKTEEVIENCKTKTYDEIMELISQGYKPHSSWYERMCRDMNLNRRMINQELETHFAGSGDNVIEGDILKKQELENVRDPSWKERDWENNVWIWKLPEPNHRYIAACLPEGEQVLTNNGIKAIDSVLPTDMLYDISGKLTKIKNTQIKYHNDFVYEIKLSNIERTTTFTGNHPIWSSKDTKLKRNYLTKHKNLDFNERYHEFNFQFNECETLQVNDWIEFPNLYYKKSITNNEITEKWKNYEEIGRVDFKVNNPLLDKEFWWFIGMWLAEGWFEKSKTSVKICTVHNISEIEYTEKIKRLVKRLFNRNVTIIPDIENNRVKTEFSSRQIYQFIIDNFNHGAKNKQINEWVKNLPDEFKIELVRGYFNGDGCISKISKSNRVAKINAKISFVSVSLKLIEDIQDILFSLKIISVSKKLRSKEKDLIIKNRNTKSGICYELNLGNYDSIELLNLFQINHEFTKLNKRTIRDSYFSEDYSKIYFKIHKIIKKPYSGLVYNFETDSHTFLCKFISTHNCDVSRGDSEDSTGYTIIDYDTFEMVLEYHGKLPPDIAAQLVYKYSIMYNALTTFDITGGMGIVATSKLKEMNFPKKLFHYDRSDEDNAFFIPGSDDIPGINFATKNRRSQIISALEVAVSRGDFKIRSIRLIAELKKFVYKNGRPDHMKGAHDDLIMALAMCLFVAEKSFAQLHKSDNLTKAMLDSWKTNVNVTPINNPSKAMLSEIIRSTPEDNKVYERNENLRTLQNTHDYSWLFGTIGKR